MTLIFLFLMLTINNMAESTFLYFAYGSNMLAERIHIKNPGAVRKGIAKLQDYRLDFNAYSNTWKGAGSTITEKRGEHVWGVLWEMNDNHLQTLDTQEGVFKNVYFAKTIEVECPNGEKKTVRVYQQCQNVTELVDIDKLPKERRPSKSYVVTIRKGAEESGLPQEYQDFLAKIMYNGKEEDDLDKSNKKFSQN